MANSGYKACKTNKRLASLLDPVMAIAPWSRKSGLQLNPMSILLFFVVKLLLKGVNIDATVELARQVDIPVIASGGVKGIDDIHVLSLHAGEGIEGVITGRALYEGKLDLAAAIAMGDKA